MDSVDKLALVLKEKIANNPLPLYPNGTFTTESLCDPHCPKCQGSGWFRYDLPRDHKDFGKLQPCPNVNMSKVLGDKSGLTAAERNQSWDAVFDDGDALKAKDAVIKCMNRGYGWVYLWGGYGLAKTMILKIGVAKWLQHNGKAAYTRMTSIMDNVREAYSQNESAEARLKFWSNLPFLAIDEFDKMRGTEFAEERRFVLMDKRYEEAVRERSVTIIASNCAPNDVGCGYLGDRILDGRFEVVHVGGQSVRPVMGWEDRGE